MKSYTLSSKVIDIHLYHKLLIDLRGVTHLTIYRVKTTELLVQLIEYILEIGKIVYLKLEIECILPCFKNVLAKNRSIRHLHIAFSHDEIYIPLDTLYILTISKYSKHVNKNKLLYNKPRFEGNGWYDYDFVKVGNDLLKMLSNNTSLIALHLENARSSTVDRVYNTISLNIAKKRCGLRYFYCRSARFLEDLTSLSINRHSTLFEIIAYDLFYKYNNFTMDMTL
jgi:hypothetical protein